MTKKRRNCGRNRHGRGRATKVNCIHCGCKPAKDKAIGRFAVRNLVDAGTQNDLKAASAYEEYTIPKLYNKNYYCVSCAVHTRIVRVRNHEVRRNRDPPMRFRRPNEQGRERREGGERRTPGAGAPAAAAPAAAPAAAEATTA